MLLRVSTNIQDKALQFLKLVCLITFLDIHRPLCEYISSVLYCHNGDVTMGQNK